MENALLIGLSRQLTLRRALDVTANNIANMSTTGFKLERPLLGDHDAARPTRADDGKRSVTFVRDWGFMRDFSPGELEYTARPFDVALAGEGFFTVQTAEGETRYTRDGRFSMNAEGQLVTAAGHLVLDDAGAPIAAPPGGDPPTVVDGGAVIVNGATIAKIGVVRFDEPAALEKAGDGTYRTDAPALAMPDGDVRAGYVEGSNVNAIEEITRMIDVTRTYQSVSRMITTDEDLKRKAIEKLSMVR